MKKIFLSLLLMAGSSTFLFSQTNVGIGTSSPDYKLDIVGTLRASSTAYFNASVCLGTTVPQNKLQVNNGGVGFFNTTETKTWLFNYTSTLHYFYLAETDANGDYITRMVVENGSGNVGIGNQNPTEKLHVTGNGRFTDNLIVDDNVTVDNHVTVDGGKGIIRNSGAAQLRYQTLQAPFAMNLPAHGSLTANIA